MNNSDLSFLTDCSNEQLRLLADVLVFDPKDHKKRYTERLSARASYAVYYPHDMKKLLPEIVDEYQRFGGNTIANIIRGHGVPYREILKDVCKTVGIAKSDTDTVEIMEAALLKTVADKNVGADCKTKCFRRTVGRRDEKICGRIYSLPGSNDGAHFDVFQ